MATYIELSELTTNIPLLQKVQAGVAILAEAIRVEAIATTDHDKRMQWAKRALLNVDGTARSLMWVLMAQNKALSVAQIEGASDTAIQNAVNSAVEILL